jgi:hypothetical protein
VRGRVAPPAAEIHAPFVALLQLLAGTVLVDDALADRRLTTTGDAALITRLAPYLPERSSLTPVAEDSAPAS